MIFVGLNTPAYSDQANQLAGSWCFYEQTGMGKTEPEKVDITFHKNGSYEWKEGTFQQNGSWSISQNQLRMSDVGAHKILSLNENEMTLERGSTMKFKKGNCDAKSWSDQDIIKFQNAASTGEIDELKDFLNRGMDVNITHWVRGDTALIKAAKFCEVEAAKFLVENGADKSIKNENGDNALNWAKSSSFHDGCEELVKFFQ